MKNLPSFLKLLPVLLLSLAVSCKKSGTTVAPAPAPPTAPTATTFTNPVLAVGPDPWVVRRGDTYYYMNTTGGNLVIRKTAKMSELGSAVSTVVWTPPAGGVNSRDVWAPELHYLDGKWYIYFTAGPGNCCGGQRLWVLENSAEDPTTGTWTEKGRIFTPTDDYWAIDATVLEQNGQRYLLWSGQPGPGNEEQRLYIARLRNPWTLEGPRVELSRPQYGWEQQGRPLVNEGPEILQHQGKTFLVYSASHCSTDDYALGLLTASSTADPMQPSSWTKSPTPVFVKNPAGQAFGPGHNAFFQSKDGSENWIIYHANARAGQGCGDTRSTRMQKFTWNPDGTPNFGSPVALGTPLPKPAGE